MSTARRTKRKAKRKAVWIELSIEQHTALKVMAARRHVAMYQLVHGWVLDQLEREVRGGGKVDSKAATSARG